LQAAKKAPMGYYHTEEKKKKQAQVIYLIERLQGKKGLGKKDRKGGRKN